MTSKPVKTFRVGACSAAVFSNPQPEEKGNGRFLTVAFSCRYRDEATGDWKDSASMRPNEVARALVVLRAALDYCWMERPPRNDAEP
jgi:hypothetical protein